jgi:hypothetical protein
LRNKPSTGLNLRQAAARREFLAPVQPPPTSSDTTVTQLEVAPQQLGLSVEEILSQRERRHRKRARQAG